MSIREYPSYTFEVADNGAVDSITWANALAEHFGAPSDAEILPPTGSAAEHDEPVRTRLTIRRFGLIGVVFAEQAAQATVETVIPDSLAARAGGGLVRHGAMLVVRYRNSTPRPVSFVQSSKKC
eukprot:SAG31_NODE_1298_length_8922_cov_18.816956_4_plen_124_part_00